jgi:hypothetical protein
MGLRLVTALVMAAAAGLAISCTGHYTVPIGSTDAGLIDGALCVLYAPCTTSSQCESGLCREYGGMGFSACTQACGPGGTCPQEPDGGAAACNKSGECKPSQPLDYCTPP